MSINVMVNGIPGNMGITVAKTALARGFNLIPFSLTGEMIVENEYDIDSLKIELLKPSNREEKIDSILADYPQLICVDYTHPSAVNQNAEFYVKHGIPFVMGTTGGDREALTALVSKHKHPSVIAPNMAKQIVAFQAMIEYLASEFPSAFDGYKLSVVESHQKTKADTSGTAKAVGGSFQKMGFSFSESDIELVRNEPEQINRMQVPEAYLSGHAFHTYSLDSQDQSVHFEFQHNICGRHVYAEGTMDAVLFLSERIHAGKPDTYNMMDVLRSGKMG